jgi:hypothetical protein
VDYLYSLYDALVSINVPSDKARAVVDAMERDMGTTLATKSDLTQLGGEVRQEIALLRKDLEMTSAILRGEIAAVRKDLETTSGALRGEIASVRKDLEMMSGSLRGEIAAVRKDLELLSTTMTVRLGSMLVAGFGLTIAALRFFQA